MMQEEQTMNKNELPYSLVMAITERGNADVVMDAARSVGAGGTVIHAKGTGCDYVTKFFGISIADEKDIVYIVAKKRDKDAIMKAIMQRTGTQSKYRTAVFSLPVERGRPAQRHGGLNAAAVRITRGRAGILLIKKRGVFKMAVSHKGAISFGLVHIPVALHTATQDNDVRFNQLCKSDHSRVRYKKVCSGCGKEAAEDEIVKGFA